MIFIIKNFAETEEGRIKQKQLELKSKISDNDFQFQVAKILKWLEKGQFVSVTIKVASRGSKEDAESLKKRIEKFIADNSDVITNASRLSIKVWYFLQNEDRHGFSNLIQLYTFNPLTDGIQIMAVLMGGGIECPPSKNLENEATESCEGSK